MRKADENARASTQRAARFFTMVTAIPRLIIAASLILILIAVSQLPGLVRDMSTDAMIAADHPALLNRDAIEETFGLRDPVIVAVESNDTHGIFTPARLALVKDLTDALGRLPNLDPDRVTSLATESSIEGSIEGLRIDPFFDEPPLSQEAASDVGARAMAMPVLVGTLVSGDGTMTLIVAELLDQDEGGDTYDAVLEEVASSFQARADAIDTSLYVAGEAAVMGHLGTYVDEDTRALYPFIALIISLTIYLAFRRLWGIVLAVGIIGATVAVPMGAMAAFGIPYFVITTALPMILIGIAIADSIHVLSRYYEEAAMDPSADQRTLVVRTLAVMWRPVVLTSLTTMAGFFGIAVTSSMPPMAWFGVFAIVGVTVALIYSVFFLPALMVLIPRRPSPAFHPDSEGRSKDPYARFLSFFGRLAVTNAGIASSLAILIAVGAAVAATGLRVDWDRLDNFRKDDPITMAEDAINEKMYGTNHLDVVFDTGEPDGLHDPEALRTIAEIQRHLETLPRVRGSVSIVDYIKEIHRGVNDGEDAFFSIPDDPDLIAQLFLLQAVSGDPTDMEEEVDQIQSKALIRAVLDHSQHSNNQVVVLETERYVQERLEGTPYTAMVSGRVAVDYYWMAPLAMNHALALAISFLLIFLMAAGLFRSFILGLLATAPVSLAVLLVYAVMGTWQIWLTPATSMFAAIAIGLGVDFSIHIIDRTRFLIREQGMSFDEAIAELYPTAGRALFFNLIVLCMVAGVMMMSALPTIFRFGAMLGIAVLANFIAAVVLLPPIMKIWGLAQRRLNEGRSPNLPT